MVEKFGSLPNYDSEIVGDATTCGVPRTDDLPIGTKRTVVTTTIIPKL